MSFHLSHAFGGSGNIGQDVRKASSKSSDLLSGGGTLVLDKMSMNAGQKNDTIAGGQRKYDLGKAEAAETEAQRVQNERTDQLLGRADASFGVGLSPEARANASRMAARRTSLTNDSLATAKGSADTNYGADLSEERANLARAGLIGSGVEAQGRSDLLAQYFGKIQGAQQGAQVAGNQFDAGNNQNRLAVRSSIRGGQIVDPSGLSTEIAGLQSQGSNPSLWSNAIGQGASAGATAFGNRKLAGAFAGSGGGGGIA